MRLRGEGGEVEGVEAGGEHKERGYGEEVSRSGTRKPLWDVDHKVERFLSGSFNGTKVPIINSDR